MIFENYPHINNKFLVACVWGTWDTWATCSTTCGGGVKIRTRKIDTYEENGGAACSGLSSEQQGCNSGTCPAGNLTIVVVLKIFTKNNNLFIL